jgi:hypothetical protein
MASTAFITPQHPPSGNADNINVSATDMHFSDSVEMVSRQWPALNPEKEDWEIVAQTTVGAATGPVVTFDVAALEAQWINGGRNPKTLKHSQSSPNLRGWADDDDDDDDEEEEETSSAVIVEEEPSVASSSMDMVSGPPSVWSMNSSNKLSFKEILQQKPKHNAATHHGNHSTLTSSSKQAKKTSFKATFVVVKPQSQKVAAGMKRNSKSMGNLRALDHIQEEILGDTDADLFYSQKAMGAKGHAIGQKIRPDEAKRLQITMNKKNLQKQRQQG